MSSFSRNHHQPTLHPTQRFSTHSQPNIIFNQPKTKLLNSRFLSPTKKKEISPPCSLSLSSKTTKKPIIFLRSCFLLFSSQKAASKQKSQQLLNKKKPTRHF